MFTIGHSLGGMETCFGQSAQGAGTRYQNTSQILSVCTFEAKGGDVKFGIAGPPAAQNLHGEP